MYLPILIGVGIFITMAILVEIEKWFFTTVLLIGTVIAMHYFEVQDLSGLLRMSPLDVALYVLGYIAAGVLWSFAKWFSYLHRFRDRYREEVEKFRGRVASQGENAEEALRSMLRYSGLAERPTAAKSRSRIIGWMTFWPISVVSTALNDPIRRIFNALFNRFKVLYQKMVDHVFRNEPDLR